MWFLRLLRHPAIAICLFGHASLVLVWALVCWSAGATDWTILYFGAVMLSLLLLLLDLPVFLLTDFEFISIIPYWLSDRSILEKILYGHDNVLLLSFLLRVLVLGSLQWLLIGMVLALPDLRNRPEP